MSLNPPGYEKDNALTRMARRMAEVNATYGSRSQGGGVPREVLGTLGVDVAPVVTEAPAPMPGVMQSGANDRGEGGISHAGLDPTEARRRELEWAATTGQKLGTLAGEVDETEAGYAGAEDYVRGMGAPGDRSPGQPDLYARSGRIISVAAQPMQVLPTVLDLTRLDGINLAQRWVTVGGVQFKYDETVARQLAEIVVRVVREAVQRDLEKALDHFAVLPVAPVVPPEDGVLHDEAPGGLPTG